MKALLNNERAPVTFGGGFIEISFSVLQRIHFLVEAARN
jgi:hypothetical protein